MSATKRKFRELSTDLLCPNDISPRFPKRSKVNPMQFECESSKKIYSILVKIFSKKFPSKMLILIADYAASIGYLSCHTRRCKNKLYYVQRDIPAECKYLPPSKYNIVPILSKNTWIYNTTEYNISSLNIHQEGLFCDDCNSLCIECNQRFKYNDCYGFNRNPANKCSQCQQFICNNIHCQMSHVSTCGNQIYLSQIKEFEKDEFQKHIFRIYTLFMSKQKYRIKLHTFDGNYPFKIHNKTYDDYTLLELKKCNEINLILTDNLGNILSNDITLLISQYGFGEIVECRFCCMEHHIVCKPSSKLLYSSPAIYETVALKFDVYKVRQNPIWLCKQLYFDGIKYPISLCTTYHQLVECRMCSNNYGSMIDGLYWGLERNGICDKCRIASVIPCEICKKYPKYSKLLHQYHDDNLHSCRCDVPKRICSSCIINHKYCDDCIEYCAACNCILPYDSTYCDVCGDYLCWGRNCDISCDDCGNTFCEMHCGQCERCEYPFCAQCLDRCIILNCDCDKQLLCKNCLSEHERIQKWSCTDCGKEYVFHPRILRDNSFGDDELRLCDGCGNNWVCFACNLLERVNENCNGKYYCKDCNENEDVFVDDGDFDKDGTDYNEDIDIDDHFDDQHEYTTLSLCNAI